MSSPDLWLLSDLDDDERSLKTRLELPSGINGTICEKVPVLIAGEMGTHNKSRILKIITSMQRSFHLPRSKSNPGLFRLPWKLPNPRRVPWLRKTKGEGVLRG